MKYDILDSTWFTVNIPSGALGIGVVAIRRHHSQEEWKAYIGVGLGDSESADTQFIAANGAKLPKLVACAYFPNLDPEMWSS